MSTDPDVRGEPLESTPGLESSWRSLEIGGILIGLLGILAILFPFITGVSLSILLGIVLVGGGIVHVAHAFRGRGWKGFLAQILLAGVYVVGGIALLVNPVIGVATLTLLLIAYLLVSGVVEALVGLRMRGEPRWGWLVASGALSVLLAVLLWVGFPATAAWALGLLVGINLLTTGISMFMVGRAVHRSRTLAEQDVGGSAGV